MKKKVFLLGLVLVLIASPIALGTTLVNMNFESADLLDVFQALGKIGGFNIIADESVRGTVSFSLNGLDVLEAVDLIARTNGLSYRMVNNTLVVASPNRIQEEFTSEELIALPLEHIDPARAVEALRNLNIDALVYPDDKNNSLLVRGEPSQIALIRAVLKEIDHSRGREFTWENENIFAVLYSLAKEAGLSLVMDSGVDGTVSMYLANMDPVQGIKLVTQRVGLEYQILDQILFVYPQDTGDLITAPEGVETFQFNFAKVSQFRAFLEVLAPRLTAVFDDDLGLLVVRGPKNEIERLGQFIRQYDRPQLLVTGVITSETGSIAIANIAGKQTLLWPGVTVGNYTVVEITSDYVKLCDGETCLGYSVWGSSF